MYKSNEDIYKAMRKHFCDSEWVDDVVLFDNGFGYDYASAFIGVTNDHRAVYDYDLMMQHIVDSGDVDGAEEKYGAAAEWIDYNTLRSLGYVKGSPIVITVSAADGAADMIAERDDLDRSMIAVGHEAALAGIGYNDEVLYWDDKLPKFPVGGGTILRIFSV